MAKAEEIKYIDFIIGQLKPYVNLDVVHEYVRNPTKNYLLSLANRWLIFSMFHISVPLYSLVSFCSIIRPLLFWKMKKFYLYAAKQIFLLGQPPGYTQIPKEFSNPYLEWSDVETFYANTSSPWNMEGTNLLFETITEGMIKVYRKLLKRWNFLTGEHKEL